MGNGITQVAAGAGYRVTIRDIAQEFLEKAVGRIDGSLRRQVDRGRMTEEALQEVLGNISLTCELDLPTAVADADLIIEAIPKRLELKRKIWGEVSEHAKEEAILATNTSSLSITEIARSVGHPERFIGMHFFNPPTHMRLVEVIPGEKTDRDTIALVNEIPESLGKTSVRVKKDVVGFIVNRVLVTYLNEAAKLLDTGEWTKEQIDGAIQFGAKMPLGPFMLSDLIGLDIVYHVLKVFEGEFGPTTAPPAP
jgi:enoyl-CoA hydratase/3-hydroxyacyl-CoA dehydrogenase